MMPKKATAEPPSREDRRAQVEADLAKFRKEWEELGSPSLIRTASLNLAPHPYIRMIRECEMMLERLARLPGAEYRGRPAGSQSAPDRTAAPPRLVAVGE